MRRVSILKKQTSEYFPRTLLRHIFQLLCVVILNLSNFTTTSEHSIFKSHINAPILHCWPLGAPSSPALSERGSLNISIQLIGTSARGILNRNFLFLCTVANWIAHPPAQHPPRGPLLYALNCQSMQSSVKTHRAEGESGVRGRAVRCTIKAGAERGVTIAPIRELRAFHLPRAGSRTAPRLADEI